MKHIISVFSVVLLCISSLCQAKVIASNQLGFTIKIERKANASAQQSYQQFLAVADWWNAEHTWFGKAENLYIEPKVNGCFCEKSGNKEALHMIISYIDPDHEIRMIGGLGPLQMLGVHGGMSWKFTAIDQHTTLITQQYQVVGFMEGGLDKLAPVVNSVQTIQIENLVKKINQQSNQND